MFIFKLSGLKSLIESIKSITLKMGKKIKYFLYVLATVFLCAMKMLARAVEKTMLGAVDIFKNLKAHKMKAAVTVFSAVICAVFTVSVAAFTEERIEATEVFHDGKSVGYIASEDGIDAMLDAVNEKVYGGVTREDIIIKKVNVSENSVMTADKLAQRLADSFDIKCALYIDGRMVAITESFTVMQVAVDNAVKRYLSEGMSFVRFCNSVELHEVAVTEEYSQKLALDLNNLNNGKYGLKVMTRRVEKYDEVIPFDKVTVVDEKRHSDYRKITVKGIDGLRSVTAHVVYLNGTKYEVQEIESSVIKSCQDEEVTIGSKKRPISYNGYVLATSILSDGEFKLAFPVECDGQTYISSFWGDGRGHKGIDIAAPRDTKIYAADDGVVTFVGYRSDYGYLITIKHYDGTETLYSHNSKNLVKVGDEVSRGQYIATVGASGNATGNHLHFAYTVDGEMIDPAPFVGLQ